MTSKYRRLDSTTTFGRQFTVHFGITTSFHIVFLPPIDRIKKNERGTYDVLVHSNLGEQKPLKQTFQGKVFVLINGRSFSGSGGTTSLMHFNKKAIFVGEECGAGYCGNTSGLMPTLTLPHTKLRVRIPMIRYHMAVSGYDYPDREIIPDYPFSRTVQDHLADKDTEMEYVLNFIEKLK